MIPNVTSVDLWAIQELPHLVGADLNTRIPAGYPDTLVAGYLTCEDVGNIIASLVGQGSIFPDRVYKPFQQMPEGSEIVNSGDGTNNAIADAYLKDKVYSVHRRGVELMVKGQEWDNDIVDGGFSLLQPGDEFNDTDVITVQFQPQISNIISSPDAIAKMTAGVKVVTADSTMTAGDYRKLIILASATTTLTYTLSAAYPENIGLFITSAYSSGLQKQATVMAGAGMSFAVDGTLTDRIFIGQNETAQLIRSGAVWVVLQYSSNNQKVGTLTMGFLAGANQIPFEGQLLIRAEVPRLTDFLTRFAAAGGTVLNETNWANNRTLWGSGDGSTTLRVPDLRGVFFRATDNGAGIDTDRENSGIGDRNGSLQADQFKEHNHLPVDENFSNLVAPANAPDGKGGHFTASIYGGTYNDNRPKVDDSRPLQPSGGTETRPVNVALTAYCNI